MSELKPIPGYQSKYAVTRDGKVWSYINSRWLCEREVGGRLYVDLSDNGIRRKNYIHRLVAEAYLPNPDGCEYVIHKNKDRTDNRVENLEWVAARGLTQVRAEVGDTHGFLTIDEVSGYTDKDGQTHVVYFCICRCGKEGVKLTSPEWKRKKSCGCDDIRTMRKKFQAEQEREKALQALRNRMKPIDDYLTGYKVSA